MTRALKSGPAGLSGTGGMRPVLACPGLSRICPAVPGHRGLGVGEDCVGRGLTVAGVHDAGLSSFQWPSETTSMLLSVTLMAV